MTPPDAPSDSVRPAGPSAYAKAVSGLSQAAPTAVTIELDEAARAALARDLGFEAIRKVRLEAEIAAFGKRDWVLTGTLGATIVQACVVTLEPVVTRIDAPVERRYLARWEEQPEAGSETEMPQDDTLEPLGTHIDPFVVLQEALALEAPDFPRTDGAEALASVTVTEPGLAPLTDEDVKPFAGLAALKAQMERKDD
ncbi:YceD family protein [Primorskyibacter sp. S187A]|uniref:YceD family protein n=1 Tax=Primorskyibacter sp. S187A TaxID=3415130 RepID=UPI003C7ABCE6